MNAKTGANKVTKPCFAQPALSIILPCDEHCEENMPKSADHNHGAWQRQMERKLNQMRGTILIKFYRPFSSRGLTNLYPVFLEFVFSAAGEYHRSLKADTSTNLIHHPHLGPSAIMLGVGSHLFHFSLLLLTHTHTHYLDNYSQKSHIYLNEKAKVIGCNP